MAYKEYSDNPQSFTEALSTGLRRGVNNILQDKMEALAQRGATRDMSSRIQALGIPAQQADYLATLPPQFQVPLLQAYAQNIGQQPQNVGAQPSMEGELPPQQFEQQMQPGFGGQPQQQPQNELQRLLSPSTSFDPKEARKQQEAMRKEQVKQAEAMRKEEVKRIATAEKETLPYYENTLKEEQASKNSERRLDNMLKKVNEGSLPYSSMYNLFKNMSESDVGKHIPLIGPLMGMFINPIVRAAGGIGSAVQRNYTSRDTEEFEKLSADFVKDVKDFFPGRVTNTDLDAFMKTIPTLSNSEHGKKAIIRNMKIMNKANFVKSQVMKDIIKENGGRRPENLAILVEERARPKLDKIGDEFKDFMSKNKQISAMNAFLFPLQTVLDQF